MAIQAEIRSAPSTPIRNISIDPLKNICSEARKPFALGHASLFLDMKPEQEVFDV
jgi:uncharacterized Zn-finger protein